MRFTGNRDIAVTVNELGASRAFYEGVMGFKPKKVEEKLVVYDTGHFTLYVQEGQPHPPVPSFTTPDIKEARKHLIEAGCAIINDRDTSLYFRDPDGVLWDIIEG
jgi:catechol 2,3-dioxygenase-like lactoylglutathione lyase family enzyme